MGRTSGLVLAACCAASHGAEVVITPEDFGAVGDGKANDWIPIKQALAACSTAVYNVTAPKACRVLFTKSYLSGPLLINSSRTTLDVAIGSTLAMLPRADYETTCPQTNCPFISTATGEEGCRTVYPNTNSPASGYKVCLSDVTLTGGGTIDGGASYDPSSWWLCARLELPNCWRPSLSEFTEVSGFTVNGSLTFKDSPNHFMRLNSMVTSRVSLTITGKLVSPSLTFCPLTHPFLDCPSFGSAVQQPKYGRHQHLWWL
jgi:polygalacturonase